MNKFLIGAVAVLLLLLLFVGCHRCGHGDTTSVVHDTTILHVQDSNTYQVPVVAVTGGQIPAEVTQKVQRLILHDTVLKDRLDTLYVYNQADVDSLLEAHYAVNYSSDTQKTRYGRVIIQDSVTQNRIASRKLITDFNIPTVSTTTTIEQKLVRGYFTLSVMGNRTNFLQAVGVGGMLQFKNDNAIEVGAFVNRVVPLPNWATMDYQFSYKHKISFTSKK